MAAGDVGEVRTVRLVARVAGLRAEQELDDSDPASTKITGRIDLVLKFLKQFDDEDAYLAGVLDKTEDGVVAVDER